MSAFVQGWGFTVASLMLIAFVFVFALIALSRELSYVKSLADYLGSAMAGGIDKAEAAVRLPSLRAEIIRDEARAIMQSNDPAWATKQVRGWLMRVQRLESALAFWVDFLRQLGLLFTVVGLGLSLTIDQANIQQLLRPLSLAVWTTVAGLFFSIWLSAQFGMTIAAWADSCEKNIEAWDARRGGPLSKNTGAA